MPNETIVQYILNVETGKAEAGLKETSQASKQVEQSFDQVGNSSTKMNQKLKQTEKQAKQTQRGFSNLRRAGRDLDGAFSDLGQGIGLISPAAGNLFMTLSNGASIAEGFGRVMVGFLNPAMLTVAAITVTAGLAFTKFQAEQKEAEERAKDLEAATKELNQALENQQKVLDAVEKEMGNYISTINEAEADLAVLKGAIDEVSLAQLKAEKAALEEGEAAVVAQQKKIKASENMIVALEKQIKKIGDVNKISDIGERQKQLAFKDRQRERIQEERDEIKEAQDEIKRIRSSAKALAEVKAETIKLKQEEQDRKKANAEAAREQKKQLNDERKAAEQRTKAAEKLQGIINKLTLGELSGREKILEQYNQELQKIEELGKVSGDMFAAAEAELLLREKRDRLLDEELRKEKERLGTAQDMLSIVAATASAMRSPEAFVSGLGGILGQAGAVSSVGAQAISGGGQAAVAIAGLGGLIQQAIDEAAKQEIPVILDEKQAERVVLGNMNEAFSNFIRDLERGLELIPETIVVVLPAFIVSIGKVLTVDLQRLIIIDLPMALLRATPELVIAIINEIGFILADLINGFRLALDQFTAFIQAVFTKEGRQDAIADSIDGLRRWFETRFTGVEAVREAVGAFAGGGSFIPQAAGGMRYTGNQRSGLAMLHQGEFVVPQSGMRPQSVDRQMSSSGGSPINIVINSPVVEQNAVDALVRRIEERFNSNFGLASSNLFGGR